MGASIVVGRILVDPSHIPQEMLRVSTVAAVAATVACAGAWWQPKPGLRWQYQLSGDVSTSVAADVFDIDLFDVPDSVTSTLRQQQRRVVCYFSAGTYENWRADWSALQGRISATEFASLLGSPLDDWPGERWLNIRSATALVHIKAVMLSRIQLAAARGCDAVEVRWVHDAGVVCVCVRPTR
jgi:hypothetical protein